MGDVFTSGKMEGYRKEDLILRFPINSDDLTENPLPQRNWGEQSK